jgi:hypothetical protein
MDIGSAMDFIKVRYTRGIIHDFLNFDYTGVNVMITIFVIFANCG